VSLGRVVKGVKLAVWTISTRIEETSSVEREKRWSKIVED
jgi:hypothetical protein